MRTRTRVLVLGLVCAALFATGHAASPGPADPGRVAEEFVEDLHAGAFARCTARFDTAMRQAMDTTRLGATWKALEAQSGAFVKRHASRRETVPPYQVVLVTCEFARAWVDVRVVLNSQVEVSGLFFQPGRRPDQTVPSYARTNAFREQGVEFGDPAWRLPGTLTLPRIGKPFPAVLLLHGSGPNDRDENVGANKPFRDLAWGLATRRIAVLRYDKRTFAHRTKLTAQPELVPTVREEVIDDAGLALRFLQQRDEIDRRRIVLAGHSLGGTLAPRVAAEHPGFAAVVVLAGSTRPLADAMVRQTEYLVRLDGIVSAEEEAHVNGLRQAAARVSALTAADRDDPQPVLGAPASYWLDLRAYDAPATAAQLRLPLWFFQGGRDYQVTEDDLAGWRRALEGRPEARFRSYPRLNHLFIAGDGASRPEEYLVPGFVSEELIDDLAERVKSLPALVSEGNGLIESVPPPKP